LPGSFHSLSQMTFGDSSEKVIGSQI
jgi:hypothetical protein